MAVTGKAALAGAALWLWAMGGPLAAAESAAAAPPHWDLLEKSCGSCHNSSDWAGGVAFDTLSADNLHADAEIWEETVRKLRGRLMPPPGEPQPEQGQVDAFVQWLETRLDATADGQVDPGYVGLHRLNRAEYAREIRRVLDLTVDVQTLLPKDVASDGFDNQAATLRISPSFLDQYIGAARAVSRQAIGRATGKSSSHEYRADPIASQLTHVDGLPLGTRGGFWVDHDFPADGEYVFSIREFFFMGAGYVTKVDHPHRVILTIDGKRVFEQSVGGPDDLKAVDQRQAIAADELQARFNHITVPVQAGRRRVGVAFVMRSFAQSDSPLQPISMLPEMERAPLIPGFIVSGPFNVTGVGDTPSRRRIFSCRPASASDELPCAKRILGELAAAAFRRPVTDEDLRAPLAFYQRARQGQDFEAGIEGGLTAILSSTKFLLRAAPTLADGKPGDIVPLTDLELASRLAFFLWDAGPDPALVQLATAGRLRDPAVLEGEVRRMLADPRAEALVDSFAMQWLGMERMDNIQPDPVLYPNFDANLRDALKQELRRFVSAQLRADRPVLELLSGDTTYLNERLAIHYGIPNVRGDQFRPVKLTDPNRFGLLGKGALMMATSYGNRTSPVLRGIWVLETLMGTPPAPAPPGVVLLSEAEPGQKLGTFRARLEAHRQAKSCNGCHGVIDPLGFALENYDVAGGWRSRDLDEGVPVDADGQLASGEHVRGPGDLTRALVARPTLFLQSLTERLFTYALGRPVRHQDMPLVRDIVRRAAADDYRFSSLVRGIVMSDAFRSRRLPAPREEPAQRVAHADPGR